jgi:hypothetical protein
MPLRTDWLARDCRSVELISSLASPVALTVQTIRDFLGLPEDSGEEEDLGFGASRFELGKGNGYTSLQVEGVVFRGRIAFYKVGIYGSAESWPRIRERIIDLWKHSNGPEFKESKDGLVHTETSEALVQAYKAAVSAELGEMKQLDIPDELKESFASLTSPIENLWYGAGEGESAIGVLVNAKRIDLIENALRGFNPVGRVYAAFALLKLKKENQIVLSADAVSTIAKVSNFDISFRTSRGCIVSFRTAKEILSELDDHPELPPDKR